MVYGSHAHLMLGSADGPTALVMLSLGSKSQPTAEGSTTRE